VSRVPEQLPEAHRITRARNLGVLVWNDLGYLRANLPHVRYRAYGKLAANTGRSSETANNFLSEYKENICKLHFYSYVHSLKSHANYLHTDIKENENFLFKTFKLELHLKILFCLMQPDIRQNITLFKVPGLRGLVLLITVALT